MTENMIPAFLASNVIASLITLIFTSKKTRADAERISAETSAALIGTALQLEERSSARFDSVSASLDRAQVELDSAKAELREFKDYVDELHRILDLHQIPRPKRPLALT